VKRVPTKYALAMSVIWGRLGTFAHSELFSEGVDKVGDERIEALCLCRCRLSFALVVHHCEPLASRNPDGRRVCWWTTDVVCKSLEVLDGGCDAKTRRTAPMTPRRRMRSKRWWTFTVRTPRSASSKVEPGEHALSWRIGVRRIVVIECGQEFSHYTRPRSSGSNLTFGALVSQRR
jgi:hypothetical protein